MVYAPLMICWSWPRPGGVIDKTDKTKISHIFGTVQTFHCSTPAPSQSIPTSVSPLLFLQPLLLIIIIILIFVIIIVCLLLV
jgi:hypothetical protein